MANENGLSILSFDGTRLAFPLSEAVGIQRNAALEDDFGVPLAIGSVVQAGLRWPVFSLSADYKPTAQVAPNNTYFVCLSADEGKTGVALACETVNAVSLRAEDTPPEPMPTCMRRESTPLQQLFRHGGQLIPVSTAPALAAYLRSLAQVNGPMEQSNG